MTEEKENCKFQQNYNVFGLDDKPCCYLYHKYCEEIDNCYFKRCKRLEQENRELKECTNTAIIEQEKLLSQLNEVRENNKELKREINDLINKNIDCNDEYGCNELIRFRSALEEIRENAEKSIKISYNLEVNSMLYDIIDKINEVLQ